MAAGQIVVFSQLKLTALACPLRRSRSRVAQRGEWKLMLVGYHICTRLAMRVRTSKRFYALHLMRIYTCVPVV